MGKDRGERLRGKAVLKDRGERSRGKVEGKDRGKSQRGKIEGKGTCELTDCSRSMTDVDRPASR